MIEHAFARRSVLRSLGALFAWSHVPRIAHAAGRDPRFLTIILRGGLDGLALLPPIGDPAYLALRESFGLTKPEASIPLTSMFALNASMPELGKLYAANQALFVHAVATPYRGRSHFDGQDMLEGGLPVKAGMADTGWLNRALEKLPRGEKLRPPPGLAIAPSVPVVMRGAAPVTTWQPQRYKYADEDTITRLLDLYELQDPRLAQSLREGAATDRLMMGANDKTAHAAGRPDFVTEAAAAAHLMAQADGPRVAAMSFYGWDTHSGQGPTTGHLSKHLRSLDDAINAIRRGLAPVWSDTVVTIVTEFGRTVRINGTQGTDHGTGTVAIVLGGAVKGGRVIADWPGLGEKQLYEGRDLAPTTDLRAVIKGLLTEHLGLDPKALSESVFPESAIVRPLQGLCA
jgi:uncharacterized protein (DUF1501 family)